MPLFNKDKIQLKKTFFLLLGFTLYPLLLFFGVAGYYLEHHYLQKNVLSELKTVERLFNHQADLHASELQTLINHMEEEPRFQEAFLSQSREKLYQTALPLFHTILDRGISHFYFIKPDRTCLLRVHNPERHGDLIDRYTAKEAARTGRFSVGLEMGPYGTFTLRAVHPWYINDELVGYIELGRDITNLTGKFKEVLGMELIFLISKIHLDRQKWEEGLWMTGKTGNWDEDKKHIILDSTFNRLPKELVKYLELSHEAKKDLIFRITIDGRDYRGGFVSLRDARDKELGEIIALRDCTSQLSSRTLSILFVSGSLLLGILIFGLFFAYANNLESRLQQTYNELNIEIHSRKNAEEQLKKHEEELELLVHERTTRLEQTNEQLQQEVKERIKIAEELLKAQRLESIGILAGGIAHDFNNLLTVILGNINMTVLDKGLSSEGKDFLQAAEKASLQARTLTQHLITFSEGGSPMGIVVDLSSLIKNALAHHLPASVTCSYDIPADLWAAKVDIKQIEQVVHNLVDNACDAMANKGQIEISCRNQDFGDQKDLSMPPHKFIEFAIKDNGCGIAEKDLAKIFDPYFSTKPKDSAKGVGLGLSIAHSIITKHDGFIRARSEEGKGSTFTVYLPACLPG
ncbi:MAG: ATP-binding protein [Thermodesulfobacteriota bacterium]